MKATVILNRDAGNLPLLGESAGAFVANVLDRHGFSADVRMVPGAAVADVAREARSDSEVIFAGGGDGTVRAVAQSLLRSERPLAVLPLGTLNHFARDLGMPTSLEPAVEALAAGQVRAVDVGEINGRVFVNNSSLGLYPEMVTQRDHQRRHGASKWAAMARASAQVLRRMAMLDVHISTSHGELWRSTPFVLVANNAYELRFPEGGVRSRIDRGELCLYVGRTKTHLGMLRLVARVLGGRLEAGADLDVVRAREVSVSTSRRQINVSLDGEVVRLKPPLRFRVLPAALRVLVPRGA